MTLASSATNDASSTRSKKTARLARDTHLPIVRASVRGDEGHAIIATLDNGCQVAIRRDGTVLTTYAPPGYFDALPEET